MNTGQSVFAKQILSGPQEHFFFFNTKTQRDFGQHKPSLMGSKGQWLVGKLPPAGTAQTPPPPKILDLPCKKQPSNQPPLSPLSLAPSQTLPILADSALPDYHRPGDKPFRCELGLSACVSPAHRQTTGGGGEPAACTSSPAPRRQEPKFTATVPCDQPTKAPRPDASQGHLRQGHRREHAPHTW